MNHLEYLRYILRHKWHVARGGFKFGVSWWRILKHDWTKFLPSEWFPYVNHFYGGRKIKRPHGLGIAAFDRAWLHHLHWNDHHWQHWLLRNDDGTTKRLLMPMPAVREMVADWYGAGYAIHGRDDLIKWYLRNQSKMEMHDDTRTLSESLLEAYYPAEFNDRNLHEPLPSSLVQPRTNPKGENE